MSQIATRGNRTPRPTRADININDFQFICTVGRGSWAKVSKVRLKSTGDVYALKSYSLKKIHEQKREEDILNEVRIHKTLNNTFIADLHYAFATKKKLYFVMDFAAGGDLFFHLQKNTTFTLEQTKFFVAEMILAVEYLHQRGIIKRALKPEDMGIDEHGHIKLFDIGLSCDGFTDYSVTTNTLCGTPEYMAPEVLKSEGYGLAVDWWGIGIMLYEMLVGLPPFYDQNIQAMYVKISNADLSFPPHVHLYARDIITRFLDRDPKTRLGVNGVQEVKQHLFFEGVDWDAMAKKQVKPTWVPTKEEIEGLLLIPDEFKGEENYDSDCEEWEEDDNDFGCSFDEKNWEEVPAQRFVMNLRTCNKFKDLDLFYTEE